MAAFHLRTNHGEGEVGDEPRQLPLAQDDQRQTQGSGADTEGHEGGGDDDLLLFCVYRLKRVVGWACWGCVPMYLGFAAGEEGDAGGGDLGEEDQAGVLHLC